MRIKPTAAPAGKPAKVVSTETWMDQEVKGCHFNDVRLAKRFRKQMADGIGESVGFGAGASRSFAAKFHWLHKTSGGRAPSNRPG